MKAVMLAAVAALGLAASGVDDKLVYADFEKVEGGRPVSARGGMIQLYAYEEDKNRASTFKGAEGMNPPAPELVRIKADDPNHLAKFEYSLLAPNQWSGVAMEIHGLPDADGRPQTEDVSGYKFLSMQLYATGVRIVRVEMRANESGKDTRTAYPLYTIAVKQGLNTYRIPMTGFNPPSWADLKVDPKKDVFPKLTSIAITAFCDQCDQPKQGMVIVDNIVFEK